MSSTPVATAQRSSLSLDIATNPPLAAVPATVETPAAPRVPVSKRIKDQFDAFKATPFGEGLSIWMNKVGTVAGYAVPAAVAAGAGYGIGGMHGSANAAIVGAVAWGVGATIATGITNAGLENVKQYRKENHPYPRLMSFRDVMSYLVLPTAVTGWAAATYFTGSPAALALGPVGGAIISSIGLQVLSVRQRRR